MAFTDFTSISQAQETFGIKYTEADYIQYDDIEPSPAFLDEFAFSLRHIDVFASERSRCENVIYPIIREVYKNYVDSFALWSHKSISYDAQLSGTPDYLISTKSALGKTVLGTPIIVVVEAKRNDFVEGWGQCLAELVAIQKINDDDVKPVYGIVTDGEMWQFGKLVQDLFTRNETVLTLNELNKVFGAIGYLMHTNLPATSELNRLTAEQQSAKTPPGSLTKPRTGSSCIERMRARRAAGQQKESSTFITPVQAAYYEAWLETRREKSIAYLETLENPDEAEAGFLDALRAVQAQDAQPAPEPKALRATERTPEQESLYNDWVEIKIEAAVKAIERLENPDELDIEILEMLQAKERTPEQRSLYNDWVEIKIEAEIEDIESLDMPDEADLKILEMLQATERTSEQEALYQDWVEYQIEFMVEHYEGKDTLDEDDAETLDMLKATERTPEQESLFKAWIDFNIRRMVKYYESLDTLDEDDAETLEMLQAVQAQDTQVTPEATAPAETPAEPTETETAPEATTPEPETPTQPETPAEPTVSEEAAQAEDVDEDAEESIEEMHAAAVDTATGLYADLSENPAHAHISP